MRGWCVLARCKFCKKPEAKLKPTGKMSYFCDFDCFKNEGIRLSQKAAKLRLKNEKKEDAKKLEVLNRTKKHWMPKADKAFQLFVRLRDHKEPCISCGRFEHQIQHDPSGGKWDGGHWLSKGAAPELRYSEDNCNKQCKDCNGVKKSGNAVRYRVGLIERVGLYRVEILEGPHELPHWQWDDYKRVYDWYNRLNKILKKELDND